MNNFSTLDAWLSHLETAHPISIDMELTRVHLIKNVLKLNFFCPIFTVGGTNGKGSTCTFLETILIQGGYNVGCYMSPHLLKFNERARLNGQNVSDKELLKHFRAVESARLSLLNPISLTYFEFTTLAILNLFASHRLEVVILEVGLGGRFDATNIIDTDCAIITNIDIDHTNYLGKDREAISFEKSGIFRVGKPVIFGDRAVPRKLAEYAKFLHTDLWIFGRDFHSEVQLEKFEKWTYIGRNRCYQNLTYPTLRGSNQLINASVSLAALEALHDKLPISIQNIKHGIESAKLPGRFQILPGKPTIIFDVAHNPASVKALVQNLINMGHFLYTTYAVFGVMRDKNILGMVQLIKSKVDYWCVTNLPSTRAATAEEIEAVLKRSELDKPYRRISKFESAEEGFCSAVKRASSNDRIIVLGSFYTVSSVMSYYSQF